jgi:hypothetical protein
MAHDDVGGGYLTRSIVSGDFVRAAQLADISNATK